MRIPEEGEKIKRMVEIAQERNIDYKPSPESMIQLNDYIDRKGLKHPLGTGNKPHIDNLLPPVYNPNPMQQLPPNYQQPSPNYPPPGYMPPPPDGHFSSGLPVYMPPGGNQGYPPMMPPGGMPPPGYPMMPQGGMP